MIVRQLQKDSIFVETPDLLDYKVFCFNGEPKYCQVISGRDETMAIDFFDYNWKHQEFHEPRNYPFAKVAPPKPSCLDQMWDLVRLLSVDKAFSRIDFYQVKDKVFGGEITFSPQVVGIGGFDPEEWDYTFGSMVNLPEVTMQE